MATERVRWAAGQPTSPYRETDALVRRRNAKARGGHGRAWMFLVSYYCAQHRLQVPGWSNYANGAVWTLAAVNRSQGSFWSWRNGLAHAVRAVRRQARGQ